MEQDLIRERYDLSMARIQEILTEETVPENYRDYFRKVTEFIIQCGEVLKAKEDGSLDQMTLEGEQMDLYVNANDIMQF